MASVYSCHKIPELCSHALTLFKIDVSLVSRDGGGGESCSFFIWGGGEGGPGPKCRTHCSTPQPLTHVPTELEGGRERQIFFIRITKLGETS